MLVIERIEENEFRFTPSGRITIRESAPLSFRRALNERRLRGRVQSLRDAWSEMVDYSEEQTSVEGTSYLHPFQDKWNLKQQPGYLQKFAPNLAAAGWEVFSLIFLENPANERGVDQKRRHQFNKLFLDAAVKRRLRITVCSDTLYLPWQMLYSSKASRDQAEPIQADHFVGFAHELEHNPFIISGDSTIRAEATDKTVLTGLHFDEKMELDVDTELVKEQRQYFHGHQFLDNRERLYKHELRAALSGGQFVDGVMYFFCHGNTDSASALPDSTALSLTKSDTGSSKDYRVTAVDFDEMLDDEQANGPLFFCNACRSGQMNNWFFEALPEVLMRKGAASLIAPQIDIPAILAHQFAKRFFDAFIRGPDKKPKTVASVLRDVSRKLFTQNQNPLGLTYSVYRGIDVAIGWEHQPEQTV